MGLKRFVNITPTELKNKGVVSLADKPNVASNYGTGGLTPTALKLWFDQIGKFIAEKVNAIQDVLSGGDAASYVRLNLTGLDEESENKDDFKYSLQDLCASYRSGKFAYYLLAYESASAEELKPLQTILNGIAAKISQANEALSNYKTLLQSAAGASKIGLPSEYGTDKTLETLIDDIFNCNLAAKTVVEAYGFTSNTKYTTSQKTLTAYLKEVAEALSAENSSVLLEKINDRYTKATADSIFRTKEDSYSKSETISKTVYNSDQGVQDSRLTNIEKTIGDMQGQDTDILGMINSINEDIDSLQLGVVPRVIRGRVKNATPDVLSAELIAALNAVVLSATGKATPDNTDAVQVIDSAMPNKGEVYTYYYWAAPESSEIDGWYVASIYTAPSVTDIPSYKFNIVASSWSSEADENKLYYITITPAMHGMGTDLALSVDLRMFYDGEYYATVPLYYITPNGNVVLFSDEKFVGECIIRCGKAYFSGNMAIQATDNGNGLVECGNGLKLLVGSKAVEVAAGAEATITVADATVQAISTATATPNTTSLSVAVTYTGGNCVIRCKNNSDGAVSAAVSYIIIGY